MAKAKLSAAVLNSLKFVRCHVAFDFQEFRFEGCRYWPRVTMST